MMRAYSYHPCAAYLPPPPTLRRGSPHSLLNLLRMYVYIYIQYRHTYIRTYLYWRVVYLPPSVLLCLLPNSLIKFASASALLMLWHTCHSENMVRRGAVLPHGRSRCPQSVHRMPISSSSSTSGALWQNFIILPKYYIR